MGGCISIQISLDDCVRCIYKCCLDGCVCCIYKRYVFDLRKNIDSLRAEVEKVQAMLQEVLHKIYMEESKGHQRLARVQHWVTEVGQVIQEASEVLYDAQAEISMLCVYGHCSTSFQSTKKYGKKVYWLLERVESLGSEKFDVVAERPILVGTRLTPVLVGQERMLEKIHESLMNDGVEVLGLYGMGGVGKTMLLSRVYSAIGAESPFDCCFWLVISRSVQINRIQDNIGKKLAIYNEEWERKSLSHKAMIIDRTLRRKRYLVLLDDLWEKLDLEKIGIPRPSRENGCKLVITSRSRNVCKAMEADAFIEVEPLEEKEARDLFQKNVGETILQSHPEIPVLARRIADRCRGLPLALKVVGASMASRRSVQEWRHALDTLNNSQTFGDPNMDEEILFILKLSYDDLDEEVKLCFLFCALFHEDQEIRKDDLVDLWKGEQIIDDRCRGFDILKILLDNQLLMEAGEFTDTVKMHGVVREMALFIASHLKEQKENFFVGSYTQVGRLSNIKDWRNVSKVSLVVEDIKTISGDFDCPKLKTLLLRDTKLECISS